MDKHIWWAWAFKSSVSLICWTVLAIVFNKWWIALFSILFISSLKTKPVNYYHKTCDGCGKYGPYADSVNEAADKAKEIGWITKRNCDKWEDYCPECQKKIV